MTMEMESDIGIAQNTQMKPVAEIARALGLSDEDYELYGSYKAKVDYNIIERLNGKPDGKLILVTAITPTPAGEGKTTTSVGLADAFSKLDKKVMLTLREPSMGPVFGMKGGAAGGGYAQVVPMEDINLHFTGDIHAVGAANNLLAAMIDNHIYQGNQLDLNPQRITWRRCIDINDRQLRFIVDGLNGKTNGLPRDDGFDITAASEIMAILCLSKNMSHLKENLRNIIVGYDMVGNPVTAGQLKAEGSMAALLKDALKPNLVQTLEHTPVFIHGGPFANIAHGCNSLIATRTALKMADYVITEAGFGADLGAEKFIDIKCRIAGLKPSAVVIVATVRALKMHGGAHKNDLSVENLTALVKGIPNLLKHIENITSNFGLPAVVAINRFPADSEAEIEMIQEKCREYGINAVLSEVWEKGGEGGVKLAEKVLGLIDNSKNDFHYLYGDELSLKGKIEVIVKKVYGGDGVDFHPGVLEELDRLQAFGFGRLPVCIAKTQFSFSDDPKKHGLPEGFIITVKSVRVSAGAGFVVASTGDIMTMPGLPKMPAAEKIDIDSKGRISGLF